MKIEQIIRGGLKSVFMVILLAIGVMLNTQKTYAESISLTIFGFDSGNNIDFNFQGLASEPAKVKDLDLKVVTDNASGYNLTIASVGDTTELATADASNPGRIYSLMTPKQAAAFNQKEWGYSLDQTVFKPIPPKNTPEKFWNKDSATPATGDVSGAGLPKLSIAVRAGGGLLEGTYGGGLVVTAITNPRPIVATFKANPRAKRYIAQGRYNNQFGNCPANSKVEFKRSQLLDTTKTTINVADAASEVPILIWSDVDSATSVKTIYWYSEADKVYAPVSAIMLFSRQSYFKSDTECFTKIDLHDIDFTKTEMIDSIFAQDSNDSSPSSLGISVNEIEKINAVNNPEYAFATTDLTNIDATKINFTNTTNFEGMFWGARAPHGFNFINLRTNRATTMRRMFQSFWGPENFELSLFDTSNVTDMFGMFDSLNHVKNINISNFNTENVTNMYSLFALSYDIETIDMTNLNTKKVRTMDTFFYRNYKLKTIYGPDRFDLASLVSSASMFQDCVQLVGGNGTTYNLGYAGNAGYARVDKPGAPGYFTKKQP